jgi:anti-sigma factor RsiW
MMTDPNEELSAALGRLPKRKAPERLKRSLEQRWLEPRASRLSRFVRPLAMLSAGAALASALFFGWREHTASLSLFTEAVNDHLRVLYAERPIEIESGGVHQVKPWFAGRVDFAPALGFGGDEEFPLQGGSVALFVERKAAAFQFKRRLHPITLFVFRADGLSWPAASVSIGGSVKVAARTERGFHTLLWRREDLGYALVSDLDERELEGLAKKLAVER